MEDNKIGIIPRWLFNVKENENCNFNYYRQATSEEKWWTSFLYGFLFFLLSNTYTYWLLSKCLTYFEGMPISSPPAKVHLAGSLLLTFIFIIVVRFTLI